MRRENRYASWRTALSSVVDIYLITDTLHGRQYVGKASGAESIRQRRSVYAVNRHGNNVEQLRYSLLRVRSRDAKAVIERTACTTSSGACHGSARTESPSSSVLLDDDFGGRAAAPGVRRMPP